MAIIIEDIGTISPSGRRTHVYTLANGTAQAEVPNDHPNPRHAATRALMLYLATDQWRSGETIISARYRMREYLHENPLLEIGPGREIGTGYGTIIFREAE